MQRHLIDEGYAKMIAVAFLEQHHSIFKVEKPILEEDVWVVEVTVSEPKERTFRVRINANTGFVLGF